MNPQIDPTIELCLTQFGIVLKDAEYGWFMAYEVTDKGYGCIHFLRDQFDLPIVDAVPDLVVDSATLRKRVADCLNQGSTVHLGG